MSSTWSPGSRRVAPCWSETCFRSRSRSARVSAGSAASRRLSRWPLAAVSTRIGLLSCPQAGQGWRWVFEIWRQIFRPPVDVGEGGSNGVRASQRLRGSEATCDDVPTPGDRMFAEASGMSPEMIPATTGSWHFSRWARAGTTIITRSRAAPGKGSDGGRSTLLITS